MYWKCSWKKYWYWNIESFGKTKRIHFIEKRNLCYTTYIGDGDSSAYPSVVVADPYKGEKITKGECIGHVQKRVCKNLRDLRKSLYKVTARKKSLERLLTLPIITYNAVMDYWNKDKKTKHKFNLPLNIRRNQKLWNYRLRDDELLQKCFHGKTQNVNGKFNNIVWSDVWSVFM